MRYYVFIGFYRIGFKPLGFWLRVSKSIKENLAGKFMVMTTFG